MTAAPGIGAEVTTAHRSGRFDKEHCLSLLARVGTGRVGLVLDALPFVYPVRYQVSGGHILFGVSPDHLAGCIDDLVIALQADGCHEERGGWTVVAVGPATRVGTTLEQRPELLPRERHAFRLRPKLFSGHWLGQAHDRG